MDCDPLNLRDALGQHHAPAGVGARIVSLVPSLTELLIDLGLERQIVGRTGFCIHPRAVVARIAKVGGTKDVDLDKVRALTPTHVVLNVDENTVATAQALREHVPHVVVTHPQTPQDNFALYAFFGALFNAQDRAAALAQRLQTEIDALQIQRFAKRRVLYVIWQDPWMTVARDTYISQTLALVNWHTWPDMAGGSGVIQPDCVPCASANSGGGAARYPTFKWSEALLHEIDLILLSSEPYRFTQTHVDALEKQTGTPVLLIDGEMTSWYGSRAIAGLRYLGELAKRA